MPFLEIANLSHRFGEKEALRNINLAIERGEVFALIGPSGAGKTTLLRLIDLLEKPSSGKIFLGGVDTDQPERVRFALRRRVAFLQQKPVVFSTTVFENVAYGLRYRGIKGSIIQEKVNAMLETIGMAGYMSRDARTLSGGEAQRLALARALVLDPELLILDELTANLDPTSAAGVEELLEGIIQKRKTTIVMATHDMVQGQRLADRIGVLIGGELLQTGKATEVFYSPENRTVAEFVGVENIIPGVVTSCADGMVTVDVGCGSTLVEAVAEYQAGERVYVFVRPEDITLSLTRTSTSARNSFDGTITRVIPRGPTALIEADCGIRLVTLVTKRSVEGMGLTPGREVFASFKATAIHITPRKTESPVNHVKKMAL